MTIPAVFAIISPRSDEIEKLRRDCPPLVCAMRATAAPIHATAPMLRSVSFLSTASCRVASASPRPAPPLLRLLRCAAPAWSCPPPRRCLATHSSHSSSSGGAPSPTAVTTGAGPAASQTSGFSAAPAAAAPSPPAAAAAAVESDAGSPFVLAPPASSADADATPSTWRRNLAVAVLCGGLLWHTASAREERLTEVNRDLVSCAPPEIHDLINVFHFTTSDLEQLYVRTMRHYRNGLVALDDFAEMVRDQVDQVKARRAAQREQRAKERAKQQYENDRAEVMAEMEIERVNARVDAGDAEAAAALPALQSSLASLRAASTLAETLRDRAAAADDLESHADSHADNKFHAIDTYVFFRTTAPKSTGASPSYRAAQGPGVGRVDDSSKKLLDVRDLMVGMSNVIFDHVDLPSRFLQRAGQKNVPESLEKLQAQWSSRDIESFTRDPQTKLHWAFRVADEDRDGRITFGQMEALLGRLIRTGHVKPETLLRAKSALPPVAPAAASTASATASSSPPPSSSTASAGGSRSLLPFEYDVASPQSLARDYFALIQQWRRVEALEKIKQEREELVADAAPASAATPARAPSPSSSSSSAVAAAPSLDLSPHYSPSATVSYPEFLAASVHFTVASDGDRGLGFWYLTPPGPTGASLGALAKWRRKWQERTKRLWSNVPTHEEAQQIDKNITVMLASN